MIEEPWRCREGAQPLHRRAADDQGEARRGSGIVAVVELAPSLFRGPLTTSQDHERTGRKNHVRLGTLSKRRSEYISIESADFEDSRVIRLSNQAWLAGSSHPESPRWISTLMSMPSPLRTLSERGDKPAQVLIPLAGRNFLGSSPASGLGSLD